MIVLERRPSKLWVGRCHECNTKFMAEDHEVTNVPPPRWYCSEIHTANCPECDAETHVSGPKYK